MALFDKKSVHFLFFLLPLIFISNNINCMKKIKKIFKKENSHPQLEAQPQKGIESPKPSEQSQICYLARLPLDIQRLIADYLPDQESDDEFYSRARYVECNIPLSTQSYKSETKSYNAEQNSHHFNPALPQIEVKFHDRVVYKELYAQKINKTKKNVIEHSLFKYPPHGSINYACSPDFSKIILLHKNFDASLSLHIINMATGKKIYEKKISQDPWNITGMTVSNDGLSFALIVKKKEENNDKYIFVKEAKTDDLIFEKKVRDDNRLHEKHPWPKFFSFNKQATKLILLAWRTGIKTFKIRDEITQKSLTSYFLSKRVCKNWPHSQQIN